MIGRLLKVLLTTMAGVFGLAVGILSWVHWQNGPLVYGSVAEVPSAPVAVVFGGGIYADGSLTPMLQDRVDTAIALYQAGKVRKLLMSGDNRFLDYDEPGRMSDYAVAHGVREGDIVCDYAGRRTYDTCYRAGFIFGVKQAVVITQRFHMMRALYTCRSLSLAAVGLAADRRTYGVEPYYWLRDALATWGAWLDIMLIHPNPVLGDRIELGL